MRLSLARRFHSKLGAPAAATRAAIASSNYSTLPSHNRGTTTPAQHHSSNISSLLSSRKYTTYSQLPSEHQMVYEMCRKFAEEELMPNAGKWDQKHEFPTDAVDKLVSSFVSFTNKFLVNVFVSHILRSIYTIIGRARPYGNQLFLRSQWIRTRRTFLRNCNGRNIPRLCFRRCHHVSSQQPLPLPH